MELVSIFGSRTQGFLENQYKGAMFGSVAYYFDRLHFSDNDNEPVRVYGSGHVYMPLLDNQKLEIRVNSVLGADCEAVEFWIDQFLFHYDMLLHVHDAARAFEIEEGLECVVSIRKEGGLKVMIHERF